MRYRWLALALGFLAAGCNVQQENGGGNVRLEPTGLFSDQTWQVGGKNILAGGDRACMVSAGGLDVTLRSHQGTIETQVAPDLPLNPGYRFTVLVNGHDYETADNWFDPGDSRAIVADFLVAHVVYTERLEIVLGIHGNMWQRFNNTIKLATFPGQYQACREFVGGRAPRR